MSLWSDIGDVFEGMADKGRDGLGVAWDAARSVGSAAGTVSDKTGATWAYENSTLPSGLKAIGEGYQKFGRLNSTALQVLDQAAPGGDPLDVQKAYDRDISPGQALVATATKARTDLNYDTVKSYAETNGENYNPWAKFTTGTADLLFSWYADPFVLTGKGLKAAHDASAVLRPGDLSALKGAHEAGSDASLSFRQHLVSNKFERLVDETRGRNTAELMQHGFLRDNSAGDTIATLISKANAEGDVAVRDQKVRDILRVGMGDNETLARLQGENDSLAHDIENLNESLDWMEEAATNPLASGRLTERLTEKSERVKAELASRASYQRELDKFLDPKNGIYGQLGARVPDLSIFDARRVGQLNRTSGVKHGILQDGLTSTPIHLVDFVAGARPNGVVHLHDAADVNVQLGHQLERVKGLDPETKGKLLGRVAEANDDASRQVVIQSVEDDVFMHVARQVLGQDVKHGDVEDILQDYRRKHAAAAERMYPTRAFGGEVDPHTGLRVDQWLDDEGIAMARPISTTQLANTLPLMDVDEVYRVLKRHKHIIRAKIANKLDWAPVVANTALSVWKFGKLARLGYPIRTVTDSQIRFLAVMGGMNVAREAYGPAFWNLLLNAGKKGAEKRHLGLGEVEVQGYKVPDFHGTTPEDFKTSYQLIDSKQHFLNLMDTGQQAVRKGLRGSGSFISRNGDDPLHEGDWLRVLNYQIRQDPLYRHILNYEAGLTNKAPEAWLKGTPEGRAVVKRLRPIYDDDLGEMVRRHAANLDLATGGHAGLRRELVNRDLTRADLKKAFPVEASRPSINAEALESSVNKGKVADAWAGIMQGFYKFASDVPETLLGRHPMAVMFYRRHLNDLIGNADPKGLGTLGAEDLERIRSAAVHLARRDMKRTAYDIASQPNMSVGMWKFIAPFYGAFKDVIEKYGRLAFDDPSRVARGYMVLDAPNRAGITVDKDGNIVAPGHPFGDDQFIVVPSIPGLSSIAKWKLSKSSANVVLAGDPVWLPGFGPVVGVSANEVAKRHPHAEKFLDSIGVLPFGAQESSLGFINPIPTWTQRLYTSGFLDKVPGLGWALGAVGLDHPQDGAAYRETFAQILAAENIAIRNGERKNPGEQELLDEVDTKTRSWYLARAAANFGLPLSATPITKYQFYFDEAHHYQDPAWQAKHPEKFRSVDPATGQASEVDAMEAFYRDYPEYFDAMVSLSKNNTGIQATAEGVDASRKWSKEIAQFPEFGAMFVGPEDEGEFSSAARANQLTTRVGPGSSMRYRDKKDPKDAITELNVSRGWITYRQYADRIDAALTQRKLQGGSDSLSAKANGDLKEAKAILVEEMAKSNADWAYDYQQRDQSRLPKFLAAAKAAVDSPKSKGRNDLDGLRLYLEYREKFRTVLASRAKAGGSASLDAEGNADLAEAWEILASHLKNTYVTFSDIYARNLEGDNLSQEAVE